MEGLLTPRGQAGGGAMLPPPPPVPRLRLGEVILGPQRTPLADVEADVVPGRGGIWALPPPPLPSERAQRAAAKVPLPDDPGSTLATPRTPGHATAGYQVCGEEGRLKRTPSGVMVRCGSPCFPGAKAQPTCL